MHILILLLSLAAPRLTPVEPIMWACAGNSYMMLQKGWVPKPPQCHVVD